MKTAFLLVALAASAEAFSTSTLSTSRVSSTEVYGYIPAGFTAESYKKFKEQEAKKAAAKKNLGGLGPRGFKSRSMQSFQEAMERGEAEHLLPMFNAKEKLRTGQIKMEDIPYMQRGGSWDQSDIKGAKRKAWLNSDREYAGGGFKKEQSVSIFGKGAGLDWTGGQARRGPSETVPGAPPKWGRNYKAPNIRDISEEQPKKKFFGLF